MPKQWKTWNIFKTEMYTKKHKYNEDKFVTAYDDLGAVRTSHPFCFIKIIHFLLFLRDTSLFLIFFPVSDKHSFLFISVSFSFLIYQFILGLIGVCVCVHVCTRVCVYSGMQEVANFPIHSCKILNYLFFIVIKCNIKFTILIFSTVLLS